MNVLRLVWLLVVLLLLQNAAGISSTSPVWVASSYFKAGTSSSI